VRVGELVVDAVVGAFVALKVGASLKPTQVVPMLVPEVLYAKPMPPIVTRGPQMPALLFTVLRAHRLPAISPFAHRRALSTRSVSFMRSTYAVLITFSNPSSVGRGPVSSLSPSKLHPRSQSHQHRPHKSRSERVRGSGCFTHS
jgi:hypothetical protein